MPARLLKKLLASKSLLRRNSYAEPWKSLLPLLDTKFIKPPPAWPNSALKPLVSTENSVIASSEGALVETQLLESARVVLAEIPSRLVP